LQESSASNKILSFLHIYLFINAGGVMAASAAAAEYSTKVEFLALLLDFIFFGHLLKLIMYQKPKF
jgi:hypothetical protein